LDFVSSDGSPAARQIRAFLREAQAILVRTAFNCPFSHRLQLAFPFHTAFS
jgi:hypothetical protein